MLSLLPTQNTGTALLALICAATSVPCVLASPVASNASSSHSEWAIQGLLAAVVGVALLAMCLFKKKKKPVAAPPTNPTPMQTNPAFSVNKGGVSLDNETLANASDDEETDLNDLAEPVKEAAPMPAPAPAHQQAAVPQQVPRQARRPQQVTQRRPLAAQPAGQPAQLRAAQGSYHQQQQQQHVPYPQAPRMAMPGMPVQGMMMPPVGGYAMPMGQAFQPQPVPMMAQPMAQPMVQPVQPAAPPIARHTKPTKAAPPRPPRDGSMSAPAPGIDPLFAGSSAVQSQAPAIPVRVSQDAPPAVVRSQKPAPKPGFNANLPPTPVPDAKKSILTSSSTEGAATSGMDSDLAAWQLARNKLTLSSELGEGFFGSVFKGTYQDSTGVVATCAIKSLHSNDEINEKDKRNFLIEALILMEFRHPHVLWLVGVSTVAEPWYIITELLELGDLKNLLLLCKDKGQSVVLAEQLQLCQQVANGMEYLASKQFIHRDLAARNCLVSSGGVVKIGDFGMSRLVLNEEDYYKAQGEDALPIRWMALESMEHYRFTLKSDVWSFGIVVFEIFSYGATPYGEMNPMIISYKVSEGERPEQPAGCPDEVYGIMNHCWKEDPAQRPTFTSLRQSIIAQQAAAPASSQDLQALFRDVLGSSDIKPAAASSDGYNKVGYHRLKDKALPGSCSPYHRLEAPIGGFKATPTPLEPENLEDALPVPEAEPYHDLDAVHKQYTSDQFIAASLSSSSSKAPGGNDAVWFHGTINRTVAERILLSQGRLNELDGTFLVRASNKGGLAISLVHGGQVWHYKINTMPDGRLSFYGKTFNNIGELVEHHKVHKENMLIALLNPCLKY